MTSLKCWFHGFEWNYDGSVRHDPRSRRLRMHRCGTGSAEDSLRDVGPLGPGSTWIQTPSSLSEFLGEVAPLLDAYSLDTYDLAQDTIVEWDCNWKIGCDAFQEGYHGPVTHPQLQAVLEDSPDLPIDLFELHSRAVYRIGAPCKRIPEEERQQGNPLLQMLAATVGVDMDAYKGHIDDIRGAIQTGMRKQLERQRSGRVESLTDDQMTDDHHFFIFPNLTINMFANNFSTFRYLPHPTDPSKMFFWAQEFMRRRAE